MPQLALPFDDEEVFLENRENPSPAELLLLRELAEEEALARLSAEDRRRYFARLAAEDRRATRESRRNLNP